MTNDLTTVEGAFQEVIDRLESNLTLRGIDDAQFDPSTGIIEQVDKIMEIEPSVNIDLDITCTLTSSENSINYGESILLSATLLASYDDTGASNVDIKTGEMTGATIQFKNGNTVIGTGVTDNNGVATLTYTPTTSPTTLNLSAVFAGTVNFQRAVSSTVNVTVNDYLELTSDKDILSAVDNEYATLTATLHSSDKANKTIVYEVRKQNPAATNTFLIDENNYGAFTENPLTLETDSIDIDFSNVTGFAGITFNSSTDHDIILMMEYDGSTNTLEVTEYDENNDYLSRNLNVDFVSVDVKNNILTYAGGSDVLQTSHEIITDSSVEQNQTISVTSEDSLIELLTGVTNSSGISNVYYYGKGSGNINIKLKNTIVQTCNIEDCLKYYGGEQSPNITFNLTLDNPVKLEWESYKPTGNNGGYIEIGRTNYWIGIGWIGSTSSKMWLYERRSAGTMAQNVQTNDLPTDTWLLTSLELNGTSAKLTVDSQTITMTNIQVDLTPLHQISNGATVKYRNIKVKPL